jgi:threonine dehydratase
VLQIKDIEDAEKTIGASIYRTPLIRSSFLSEKTGSEFHLKLENLQMTGSFKIRGAMNKLSSISSFPRRKIITASAGNHGQAVALCAQKLGLSAIIIVPETTPKIKIEKIKLYGAEIELHGSIYDETEKYAIGLAKADEDLLYVSPYNDEMVIAGQGTIGLEILAQMPDVDALVVPVGGGGLISGVGLAAKSFKPTVEIIGVEPEASPSVYESLRAGRIVNSKVENTIADGLSGNIEQVSITFEYMQRFVDRMLLVKEDSIKSALKTLWAKDGQVSEGAAAASVAAALEHGSLFSGKRVVAILSGSNIDSALLKSIVASHS